MSQSQLDRIKLLMEYSLKKTYTENLTKINKKKLSEQSVIGAPNYGTIGYEEEDPNAWIEEYKVKCGNNPNLIIPQKNEFGAEGKEAIISVSVPVKETWQSQEEFEKEQNSNNLKEQTGAMGVEDIETSLKTIPPNSFYPNGVDGVVGPAGPQEPERKNPKQEVQFCLYKTPIINKSSVYVASEKMPVVWISSLAIPYFFTEQTIKQLVNNVADDIERSPLSELPGFNKEEIIENLTSLLSPNDLSGWRDGNKNYSLSVQHVEGNYFKFVGYTDVNTMSFYKPPKWEDKRTPYQAFIDRYGLWLQLGAAVVVGIAGAVTGGAAWVLYAEIATEGILGGIVAQREFERGDNVSGTFSLIFGGLPVAKLFKTFRGVKPEVFESLSKKLADNPNAFKSEKEFNDFVTITLNDDEAKLLNEAIRRDEKTWNELSSYIKGEGGEALTKEIKNEALAILKKTPDLIESIDWYKRIWAREWGVNIATMTLALVVEVKFGEQLNNETKQRISKVFANIPESLQKEITYNLAHNAEFMDEIMKDMITNFEEISKAKEDSQVEHAIEYLQAQRNAAEDAIISNGGEYKETEFDEEKSTNPKGDIQQQIKKLKDEGCVTFNELKGRDWDKSYTLGGVILYKPIDNNIKPIEN